ncbi:hypothetical protein D3C78_1861380 [compost metagenome]
MRSTSAWVSWPPVVSNTSSFTAPVATPLIVGTSLVPLMVMVTLVVAVPSRLVTV